MTRLVDALTHPVGVAPHDHLSWGYTGREAWREAATGFLGEGARRGEHLLYVAYGTETELVDDLAGLPGRDDLLASGALRVQDASGLYGPPEQFDGVLQTATYAAMARETQEAGYPALRVAADITRQLLTPEDVALFAAYEVLIDTMVSESPLLTMCGFDAGTADASAALALAFVHPISSTGVEVPDGRLTSGGDGGWRLSGELDRRNLADLCHALDVLLAVPEPRDLHLDLRRLVFADVASLRALVTAARRLEPGRRIVLHSTPPLVRQVLRAGFGAENLEVHA